MQGHDATLDAREAVTVFETAQMLQGAIDELLVSGFDRADLSFLASAATAKMKLSHKHARRIQEQLDQGGLLLWVRARDQEHEDRATSVLQKHGGRDIHVIRSLWAGRRPHSAPNATSTQPFSFGFVE